MKQYIRLALFALGLLLVPAQAIAQGRLSQSEALRLAFGDDARIERRTAYLDTAAVGSAQRLAGRGVEMNTRVVTYYVAYRGGRVLGAAYFDAHRVRTMNEVVMVVVSPESRVARVEILSFAEPPQYRAPEGWIDQVEGKGLNDGLSLKGGVVNMTGATLTSQALVNASRRVLALHQVIRPFAPARPAPATRVAP